MVGPKRDSPNPAPGPEKAAAAPWERTAELGRLAFVTFWTTGPDPARDGVFRIQAARRAAGGGWERLDLWTDPFGPDRREPDEAQRATARMAREYGVTGADLSAAGPAPAARAELDAFLRGRTAVTADREAFRAWRLALGGTDAGGPARTVDLASLAALVSPGRLPAAGEDLPRQLCGGDTGPLDPGALRTALAVLVGRVLSRPVQALAVLAHALVDLDEALRGWVPDTADELALAASLLEHPSRWRGEDDALFPEHAALTDGQLSDALRVYETLEDALEAAAPSWARGDQRDMPPLSPVGDEPTPLDAADRRRVDEIFQEHLPRRFASAAGEASYRAGQHAVAARVAESFGARELLLMHAPTGTGKTLAYLVPTLAWAVRNQVRVGVATFTRALQEQAMERDVPLALEVLKAAGIPRPRVSVLKGRANYLCWRALVNQLPGAESSPHELLVWLVVALFGLGDDDGDLDRLAVRPPLGCDDAGRWRRDVSRLVRLVRAETGCCTLAADRDTCAAEAARRRAERSHLVLTNHAFALARREFFRFLVFDECEHLHDVAHNAFSHAVGVRALRDLLARVRGRDGQGLVERVRRHAVEGSAVGAAAEECAYAARRAGWALDALNDAMVDFKDWRDARLSERKPDDQHSLFREFVEGDDAAGLLGAHAALNNALNELAIGLQRLAEHLDSLPARSARMLRRRLELARNELDDQLSGVQAWIPRGDGLRPALRSQTFHDLETTPGGDDVLAARVLLPHEYLGRHYYPDLSGAVFLSATTWLKDGFDTAATYLGLARAALPAEDEDRLPSTLVTFRAPEAFDYGRVLVSVPRDAPIVTQDKRAFLSYVARFVGFLAERTRGRMLVLFTNADDLASVGRELAPFFRERHLPFWYQRMEGSSKEELGQLFRAHTDSVLFGLDTFWYGTDFPGNTLEYLVVVRLPYGVPDRYHRAQCATLGVAEQRRQIYMPRALAKFRQGFGRLMRRETDKGCVFVLDRRVLDPRHRAFLRELPVRGPLEADEDTAAAARLVLGDTDRCLDASLAHMDMKRDVEQRGLARSFAGWTPADGAARTREPDVVPWVAPDELPF